MFKSLVLSTPTRYTCSVFGRNSTKGRKKLEIPIREMQNFN